MSEWTVLLSQRAAKQLKHLPRGARDALARLLLDIRHGGPVRGDWPNYGKLGGERHHCHLKKGQPTYVAVWQVTDKSIRLIEVTYAGTHEKAPY
jgi:mRNA-degrading endonuclease RelE of RelBE toxin-antitoxin system